MTAGQGLIGRTGMGKGTGNHTVKPTVLIVDDEPLFTAMTTDALESGGKQGYRVLTADSGEKALWHMKESNLDAVMADLYLPEMDGVELLTRFSKNRPDVLRILVSAKLDTEQLMRAVNEARVHAVLSKPLDHEHMLNLLDELRAERARMMQAERLAAVGELVGGVAHELNNPLTAVIGFTELLLKEAPDESSREDLSNVLQAAQRAARIVKNLSAFAVPAHKGQEEVELNALVRTVADMKTRELEEHEIEVILDLDPSSPTCWGNPSALRKMLLNIFANAEQACKKKTVPDEKRRIWLRTRFGEDNDVEIHIEDDGIGIPKENLHRVFEPFFSTKELKPGRGLGLSVAHGIACSHGGRILVESEEGKGALFKVVLPAAKVRVSEQRQEPGKQASVIEKALIVEDEPGVREYLCRLLEREGISVKSADNSMHALRLLKSGFVPDVVLCDLRLPDLEGPQLQKKVAEHSPHFSNLANRFIFITGDTANQNSVDFMERSASPCLAKPFSRDELMEAFNKVSARSKAGMTGAGR